MKSKKYWGEDALEFRPERYFNNEKNQLIRDDRIVPFSVGKKDKNILFILMNGNLMDGPSVKYVNNKNFFVFHSNSIKLGEPLVHIDNYNFTNFHWI